MFVLVNKGSVENMVTVSQVSQASTKVAKLKRVRHQPTSFPRPGSSEAKRNRAKRVYKMAETNPKRRTAKLNQRKQRQAQLQHIREEKEFIRGEKKRIKDNLHRARLKLADEKKKIQQLRKATKVDIQCSPEKANNLSIAMARLVPTSAEISNLSHAQYVKLRSDMSKLLSGMRAYAQKCNAGFVAKKRSKPAAKRRATALSIPFRQTFIPNIGLTVPDKIPVSEKAFNDAKNRLNAGRYNAKPVVEKNKKKKKRIAPTLVRNLFP